MPTAHPHHPTRADGDGGTPDGLVSPTGAVDAPVPLLDRGWDGRRLGHEGFFFDDPAQVLDRCLPFIEDGFDSGQPVLVVASDPIRDALTDALDDRHPQLAACEPAERWWRGPHPTMAAYLDAMAPLEQAGRPWRLVAEPIWLAQPGGRYWSRFEAVANEALGDRPYYSLCLHDHRRLGPALTAEARCTHPVVNDATDASASSCWEGAAAFLASVEPSPVSRPGYVEAVGHGALRSVRDHVEALGTQAGLGPARIADVSLVVDELAANSLALVDEVAIAGWTVDGTLVVEVTDDGPGLDDPLAGYVLPSPGSNRGRGLWIARALSDDMVIRASPSGTAIQVLIDLT